MSAGQVYQRGELLYRVRGEDELELIFPSRGFRSVASGIVAAELCSLFDGGEMSERLKSLGQALPWLSWVTGSGESSEALTAAHALSHGSSHILFLELTGNCNERCEHCYAESSPSVKASLSREQIIHCLDDAVELGFPFVQLTGGDPFLSPYLFDAVEHAHGLGLRIEIYTNGILLTDKRVERLRPYAPSMAFSVYSHLPELHDQVTRTPGSLAKTLAAIERSLAAGFDTRVGLVAMAANQESLADTVDTLKGMGVERIHVTPSFEVGRGERFEGTLPEGVWRGHAGPPVLASELEKGQGPKKLCVTYEGDVVPCIFNRKQRLGTLAQGRGLAQIVRRPSLCSAAEGQAFDAFLLECNRSLQCTDCRFTAAALELLRGAR